MKFFGLASILCLAAFTIAVPVVEVAERQSATATSCKTSAGSGQQICCAPSVGGENGGSTGELAGLLAVVPAIGCLGVLIINLQAACPQQPMCCIGQDGSNTGLIQVAPGAVICPEVVSI